MSGHPAAYDTKEEFDELMLFIKDSSILNNVCSTKLPASNNSEFRLGE